MTLLVRAIVRTGDVDRAAASGLVPVSAERVAALVSRREGAPRSTEAELRDHDAITRSVHEAVPSLPSRFGDVFVDEDSLASTLRAREDALATDLERVGDRVQIDVTLRWRDRAIATDDTKVQGASTGRAYLMARAVREGERREAERIVGGLVEQLPCERAFIRHRICPRDGVAAIVAILSTRDGVSALREHIDAFAERTGEVMADIHGPLPPFAFVS